MSFPIPIPSNRHDSNLSDVISATSVISVVSVVLPPSIDTLTFSFIVVVWVRHDVYWPPMTEMYRQFPECRVLDFGECYDLPSIQVLQNYNNKRLVVLLPGNRASFGQWCILESEYIASFYPIQTEFLGEFRRRYNGVDWSRQTATLRP
jgi:hypothetical protein